MYRKETSVPVNLSAHEFQDILLFKTGKKILQSRFDFRALGFVPSLSGKFVEGFKVFHFFLEFFPGFITVFQALELAQGLLRPGAVVPEIRFPGCGLKTGYALLKSCFFKDASMYR